MAGMANKKLRPMETCPRDGSWFAVAMADYWIAVRWQERDYGLCLLDHRGEDWSPLSPAGWLPLPNPRKLHSLPHSKAFLAEMEARRGEELGA